MAQGSMFFNKYYKENLKKKSLNTITYICGHYVTYLECSSYPDPSKNIGTDDSTT